MKRIISLFMCIAVHSLWGYAQSDTRPVVGVAQFTCDGSYKYAGLVTEKVVEMLTNTHRFQVVDRTSYDKVHAELELQKSEAFIDSKNIANQGVAVAAEKMITGHIAKIPVYAMKNPDGSVKGYKASVAFQMKVVDVETGLSTEATSFQGQTSEIMMSPESAVTQSMFSLQKELEEYFRKNFPLSAEIIKILDYKKEVAGTLLLNVGKSHGIAVGDQFRVEYIEMLNWKPYPTVIGEITVTKLPGNDFAECSVPKKIGAELLARFQAAEKLNCSLIVK
ncbi:CsgG/HfaB family protein [uncultured Alistipes sp.]|uniref:CsgG/HfaB family protein n=1 Tax=uncultured Alistipes sp. TaxID=538949 RepID=UPI00272B0892|nr:CsgG/HfaB family protein [uncultured Alistipes sp.]